MSTSNGETVDGDVIVFTDRHKEKKYESMIPGVFIHTRSITFPDVINSIITRQEKIKKMDKVRKMYVIIDLDEIDGLTVNALANIPNDLNITKIDATNGKTTIASVILPDNMIKFAELVQRDDKVEKKIYHYNC